MQDHIINDQIADLARAMLELDNMDEAYRFFEDIFTIHELQAVAQRLAVARLLQKKVTYQEIAERTGASTATISSTITFLIRLFLIIFSYPFRSFSVWRRCSRSHTYLRFPLCRAASYLCQDFSLFCCSRQSRRQDCI